MALLVSKLDYRNLLDAGHISDSQYKVIVETDEELSGDAVEKLLIEDHKINHHQLLIAKSRAFGLSPINVRKCLVNENTFSKLDQDFCQQNKILPLGFAGEHIIVALSNPFDLGVIARIQEISGMRPCVAGT